MHLIQALVISTLLGVAFLQAGFKEEGYTPEKWLNAHNIHRQEHCTEDLVWNETLAEAGKEWAEKCDFVSDIESPFGQNAWKGSGTFLGFFNASRAVDSWYNQVGNYDFENPKFSTDVGAVTQVLWKSSTQLGCGVAVCNESKPSVKSIIAVCYYNPSGNFANQLAENVLAPCEVTPKIEAQVLSLFKGEAPPQTEQTQKEVVTVQVSVGVPSPKDISLVWEETVEDEQQDWVDAHNLKREAHCIPDVKWNATLAEAAENVAEGCAFSDTLPLPNTGANQFQSLGTEIDPDMVVAQWYSELENYDFEAAAWSNTSGSFTQLVWKTTQTIGCAIGKACCPEFSTSGECPDAKRYAICLYYPSGNFIGQFKENVLPLCASN